MIILYEHTETSFTSNGLGCLNDVLTCNVKEELNGNYELEMEYPVNGIHYSDIALRRIVLTKPNSYDQAQPFRIYSISKPINGIVTINAEHISYDMSGYPVKGAVEHYAWYVKEVFNHIRNNSVYSFPFEFSSDITEEKKDINLSKPRSARSYLGTEEGLLSLFGGEWEFDRFKAILHKQRGTNRGVSIEYGKNLIDVTQDEKCSEMYTAVYPFYYKEDDGLQYLDDNVVPIISSAYIKTLTLDLTSEFEEMPTQDALREKTKEYIKKNKLDEPEVSLKVSFVKNPEVIESLQDVRLGDTVGVKFVKIGVNSSARCIGYEFNSITEQYNSVELGEPTKTIVDTMTSTNQKLSEEEQRAKEAEEKLKTLVNVNTGAIELEVQRAMGVENSLSSSISLNADTITAEVQRAMGVEGYISASLDLKIDKTDNGQIISMINGSADHIHFNASNMFTVDSPNFSINNTGNVEMSGTVNATSGKISYFEISENGLEWSTPQWGKYGTRVWANSIYTSYIIPSAESTHITLGDSSKETNLRGDFVNISGDYININGTSLLVNDKSVAFDDHNHYIDELWYSTTSANNIFFKGNIGGFNYNLATTGWCSEKFEKKGSDFRLKKNISDLGDITDFYMKLKPKRYEFKDGLRGYDSRVHYGFIAQDIASVEPESSNLVYKKLCDDDLSNEREVINDDYVYYVDKSELHAMHVHMIQKQHDEIEELKQVNLSLLNRLSTLEMKMEVI